MDQSTLCCILLLPLCWCFDSEVTVEKTIGREPDVTPICPNETLSTITVIVCTIRREKNREKCHLLYMYREGFESRCNSSRFTLMEENQAVFLNLTSLTPEDNGIYTCKCSSPEGTYILHLNIIVEAEEYTSKSTNPGVVTGVMIVVIITAVVSGFIYRRMHNGNRSRSDATCGSSVCETPGSLDDPYMSLQRPASDLYQTISYSDRNMEAVDGYNQEMDRGDVDPSCEIYENIQMKQSTSTKA